MRACGPIAFLGAKMRIDPFARSERGFAMFRRFLSLSAGVLVLLCVTGIPGQLHAAPRFSPGMNRGFMNPGFGRFSPGMNREFMNPGFGRFSPGMDPRF